MTKNDLGIRIRRVIKFFWFGLPSFIQQFFQYLIYSKTVNQFKSETRLISTIVARYHVIEKGLTMSDRRLGFGKQNILDLLEDLAKYRSLKYNINHEQYIHALKVIKEYIEIHENSGYKLDNEILQLFSSMNCNLEHHTQPQFAAERYFSDTNQSFDKFSFSRHSLRSFSDENIEDELISKAIDIAQNTPTPCNRQPNKVYVLSDRTKILKLLSLQGGSRGFGETGNKLLILTTDISVFSGVAERNESYKSGGMYAMNLLYALHFNEIGACSLQWGESLKKNKELRKVVDIPRSEIVIMMFLIGKPAKTFSVADSCRNPSVNVIQFVD